MRIAQILLDGVAEYERKMQRIDHEALAPVHDLVVVRSTTGIDADVAHVYGPRLLHEAPAIPYVANADVRRRRFAFRRLPRPGYVVSPLADENRELLPEAVEERYFNHVTTGQSRVTSLVRQGQFLPSEDLPQQLATSDPQFVRHVVGVFGPGRPGVGNMIDLTRVRLARFRDDINFRTFHQAPQPVDFGLVDAWIDPATDDSDFDGFVAEALVRERPVVASRTPINAQRLENGRTGLLVPAGDPNELAHAILAALFKSEVAHARINAARQTISKFRARQRLRVLMRIYETLLK
jgi:hypothetical protein